MAITLYSRTDEALWQAVEKLTRRRLAETRLPGFAYAADQSEPKLTRRQQSERRRQAGPAHDSRHRSGAASGRRPARRA